MVLAMIGTPEIIIIVVVVLLIFGPSKLPQLGAGVGKMLRGFKKEMKAIDDDKQADDAAAQSPAIESEGEEIDVTPKKSAET